MQLVMHTDLSCPFCYLGESVVAGLRGEWDFDTRWVPFELHPEVPSGGAELTEAGLRRTAPLWNGVMGLAAALKVPFNPPGILINTRRALGALLAASEVDETAAEALRWAFYRGYFVDGLNLSSPVVIADLVRATLPEGGAAADAAIEAAETESRVEALVALKEEGFDALVTGVPVFRPHVDGQERLDRRVTGAQPEEIFVEVLSSLDVARREVSA